MLQNIIICVDVVGDSQHSRRNRPSESARLRFYGSASMLQLQAVRMGVQASGRHRGAFARLQIHVVNPSRSGKLVHASNCH